MYQVKETAVPNSTPMIMNNMATTASIAIPLPAAAMHMEPMCVNNVLPPDVPDVQTIEKLHMKQLQAMQHQQGATAATTYVCAPMMPTNHHMPISVGYVAFPLTTVMTGQPLTMAQPVACGGEDEAMVADRNCAGPVPDNNCDSEQGRRTSSGGNGGSAPNRPAVVIMSGEGNDVSGLTFGFDINEQLLSDDVCDNFVARFAVPEVELNENHDRIVSFIANG